MNARVFKAKKEKKKKKRSLELFFSCISEEYWCEHQEGVVEKNGVFFLGGGDYAEKCL